MDYSSAVGRVFYAQGKTEKLGLGVGGHYRGAHRSAGSDPARQLLVVYAGRGADYAGAVSAPLVLRRGDMRIIYIRLPAFLRRVFVRGGRAEE